MILNISIIVPIYKVEKYLNKCIDSIINQTYKNFEIILVDDGSPDKSGEICDEYKKKYDFIEVIHKKNKGLGMARNSGLDIARGDFVMFIDSDDYIEPNLIEDMVEGLIKTESETVIASYCREYKGNIKKIENPIKNKFYSGKAVLMELLPKMIGPLGDGSDMVNMASTSVLYSLDIINKNNIRFPSEREFISEDIIFNLNYYKYTQKVYGVENTGYIYCMNENSLTQKYNSKRFEMGKILFLEKKRFLEELKIYNFCKFRAEESFLRYSRYAIKSEVKNWKINGSEKTEINIKNIIQDKELINIMNNHLENGNIIVDKFINYCIKMNRYRVLYLTLRLAYSIKKRK